MTNKKKRSDSWTHEDDLMLAETVLRHIRTGSTQLRAFAEVGEKLERSSSACGFRWNHTVRKQYKSAMELAKTHRNKLIKRKKANDSDQEEDIVQTEIDEATTINSDNNVTFTATTNDKTFSTINIEGLTEEQASLVNQIIENLVKTEREEDRKKRLNELEEENKVLKKQLKDMKQEYDEIKEDYEGFMKIIGRAQRRGILEKSDNNIKENA
ncbi:RsfA family transcriptional regulator [Desertibacillus haloalkaliphilus]|uniref:RsfA family transcriptional regulator n=1 Tax=Desertibacillus haloalkaliphilus TaxID=1328930 RepID=UPI001C26A68A|nr:RsfA family transcriptional regulator [Desertibacillus haloalkaliphilus]MBU8908153.1 RsfA family transcriptional regulator [Desertibacillus haloalkaliphilus]